MRKLKTALAAALVLILATTSTVFGHDGIDRLTNEFRQSQGSDWLWTDSNLYQLARIRAQQISTNFEHNFWWWGRTDCAWVGENIAWRRPVVDTNKAEWFVEAWKDSPTHRENMLNPRWETQGSAIYISDDGGMYGVQLFCAFK